ncbi:response regulator transcription factor [Novosphingobium profundi]|uniref:response regulator transcription factor n=1 Tax=Novosphingobium profundi TaxID=1774954 RepID=UPI001BDA86D6|nr:LuxR C-terminal-related transcriptional regulator [Novosphingobium profundi]MBT0670561.1 response regulator transcription factor [Novosphingobium profundi]
MSERLVYVVDDDKAIRASLEALIPLLHACSIVEFGSGEDFISKAGSLEPGCLLLDLCMPVTSGLDVLRFTQGMPGQFVPVMMSGRGEIADAVTAMKMGAFDFITKDRQFQNLAPVLDRAFEHLETTGSVLRAKDKAGSLLKTLSQREREVLNALIDGQGNKGIAHRLNISPRTVEVHRAKMMEKLGARNLQEALRIAFAGGMIVS